MESKVLLRLSPPSWTCKCCLEEHQDHNAFNVQRQKLCKTCLQEMFNRALAHEIHYPPAWLGLALHPRHFDIVSPEFIADYEEKEKLYTCPLQKRAWCQHPVSDASDPGKRTTCGAFIGRLRKHEESGNILIVASCDACHGLTCLTCGKALSTVAELEGHGCDEHIAKASAEIQQEEEAAFDGFQQGRHFQRCPNAGCGRVVELSEACNHVICGYCRTSFCFISGTKQDGDSSHWRRGGCPRYNFVGDDDARFEGEDDEAGAWGGWNYEQRAGRGSPPASPRMSPGAGSRARSRSSEASSVRRRWDPVLASPRMSPRVRSRAPSAASAASSQRSIFGLFD